MAKNIFPERIKELRTSHDLTMEEFGKKIGKAKSTISLWESGKRSPKIWELVNIENIFGVDAQSLVYDTSEKKVTTLSEINRISSQLEESRQEIVLNTANAQLEEQQNKNIIQLRERVYNYYDNAVSAGTGQYLTDGKQETITLPVDYDADFVVPVCGDSMEPIYHDWDYVFVETTYDLYDGDIGVFILDGEAYIKELCIDDEGAFLHSLNPKYRDKPVLPESDFRIVGKVIGRYNENDKQS